MSNVSRCWVILCAVLLGVLLIGAGSAAAQKGDASGAKPAAPDSCGVKWRNVYSPNTSTTATNTLEDIDAVSTGNVWAVGYRITDGGVFRTMIQHWDGTEWSIVSSPNAGSSSSSNFLNSVVAVSANDVWAGGYYYASGGVATTLLLHWNGSTWSVSASSQPGEIESLDAVSATNVWAVGHVYSSPAERTLSLNWNGSTWAAAATPNIGTAANSLYDVSATSAGTVYAVGSYYDSALAKTRSLAMRRNGSAWELVSGTTSTGDSETLFGVEVLSAGNIWAVGTWDSQTTDDLTYIVHWNGSSWAQITSPNPSTRTNELVDISAVSANDIWAVGNYTTVGNVVTKPFSAHWNGASWSTVEVPDGIGENTVLASVSALSASEAWSAGQFRNAGNDNSTYVARWNDPCASPAPCTTAYSDVPTNHTFYQYVRCLSCREVLGGYPDGTFRPGNDITRGQLAKIISNAADFVEDPGSQLFEDVADNSTFYPYIQRLANREIISGYACGGAGEPCGAGNRPYFRPGASATRGQITKIVSNAVGFEDVHSEETFQDAPVGNTYHLYIERLASRSIMSGYPCGAPGEPCVSPLNKPYFRPGVNATRGQLSKIVSVTFFPVCPTP